jgi:type IV pilus assembly protein PilO
MGFLAKLETIPSQYRWAMLPALLLVLGTAYWFFLYSPQAEAIERVQGQIDRQRLTLEKHRKIAAQYDAFKEQVEELELDLRRALVQLPDSKEIPDLLRQISDLGVRSGLQITFLRPQAERRHEFHAEVPITFKVVGPFHAVGRFFDDVSRLSRIISVNQVKMGLATKAEAKDLDTECLLTTFRFLDAEEVVNATASDQKRNANTKRKK